MTRPLGFVLLLIALAFPSLVRAADEGQEDLDLATQKKIEAKTLGQLGEVVQLCEMALKKGLDESNQVFAKQLLSSTLLQRATVLTNPIFEQSPPAPQWAQLRTLALADLEKAVAADPKLGEAQLLIARLQALPRGDADAAMAAADAAIEAFADDARKQSQAYTARAQMQTEAEKQLADLNKALEIFPANDEALRRRGVHYIQAGEQEKGLADLSKVLELNPDDVGAHRAASEALANLDKFDEALEHLNKSIELNKESGAGYVLRARLFARQDKWDKAEEDLNAALKQNPRLLPALLMRAEVRARLEKFKEAQKDIDRVLESSPGLPPAVLLRAGILAAQKKYLAAISDLEQLLKRDPTNAEIRLQIATFYVADQRPSKAIEIYTEILADDPENFQALRSRGDALLSIAKQEEAIEDYEAALKLNDESDGLYNNLAWVLSTSPEEKLRDGKRAIELAKKACELTEYKAAHILSTLGAAYAETGDFETAKEWSKKAIELASEEELVPLKKELENYEKGEPTRELQDVKERPAPPSADPSDLEL